MYNTAFNTVGVGDPVPFGQHGCSFGSGDRFDNGFASRGKVGNSYKLYKPAKMTFSKPKKLKVPGFPPPPPMHMRSLRFKPFGMVPPPPPRFKPFGMVPPPPPLPRPLIMMPFGLATKRSAASTGSVKSYTNPRPLIVKVSGTKTKKRKK